MEIIGIIESLQYISTYCFFLDRNKFFLILYFNANPKTSQYDSNKEIRNFTNIFADFLEHDTPNTVDTTYSFPQKQEVATLNNARMLSMLDDDNSNKPSTTSSKNKKFYYAVSTGRTVGIFNDWVEAHASICGYSHAAQKIFESKEDAEICLNNNQGFTPAHERTPSSYRNIAQIQHNQHKPRRKQPILHNITEDNDSLSSKSTSSITLSTIRTECPEEHLVTLKILISSGSGIETLKKVVPDWSKDTSIQNPVN